MLLQPNGGKRVTQPNVLSLACFPKNSSASKPLLGKALLLVAFVWIPPAADSETRIHAQAVFLGSEGNSSGQGGK